MLRMRTFAAAAFAVIGAGHASAQADSFESVVKSYYDSQYAAHP